MAAASVMSTSSNKNTKIVWFWQSNPNPSDEKEKQEWQRYSDFENEFIEEVYQRKENEVQLNDYVISFKYNIQFKRVDRNRQRPVRREEINATQYVREERFSYPQRAVKSFDSQFEMEHSISWQWKKKNVQLVADGNYLAIAQLAAQGKSLRRFSQLLDVSCVFSLQAF
jgi:hypothetical protein